MEGRDRKLKDIYGNYFEMNQVDSDSIGILAGGYIITPEGLCVEVRNGEDHNAVFSEYLYNYFGKEKELYFESTEAAAKLAEINHVAYFGIKLKDASHGMQSTNGKGVFFIPSGSNGLTDEQKLLVKKLIDSNTSHLWGTPIFDLSFGDPNNRVEYTFEEMGKIINTNSKLK